ncbi:hypothetical protein GCM10027445_34880 [Amycolatopsis endophytica]|uniref:Epoxide hydrolase n=1 Tax=Amycolatopsis endophytica TaxID=860233 RepID=A0A853BCD6_9PSEU|nr:hypothetical protein [Amycolatopsis endophytica]NYI92046.1 hypothetical protein [Amycolatopsis endophytica]
MIDPLADPAASGGDPADAFDVIVPSLPGFGFPGPLTGFPDVNFWKVADLWHTLMTETLGYGKYAAGGCDIGGIVSSQLGHKYADSLYVESVFTGDELLTHATIYWVNNSIATSMRYYANANRHPWTPAHDRTPVVQAPVGLTLVTCENPPGIDGGDERVRAFETGPQGEWFNHVNVAAHERGGHFIPWENPQAWVSDLRRTFRGLRP